MFFKTKNAITTLVVGITVISSVLGGLSLTNLLPNSPKTANAANFTITAANIAPGGECRPGFPPSSNVGQSVSCVFTLVGAPSGDTYVINSAIFARYTNTPTDAVSLNCVVDQFSPLLVCNGLPINATTEGIKNIDLDSRDFIINNQTQLEVKAVTLGGNVNNTNIGAGRCDPVSPVANQFGFAVVGQSVNCQFPLTGSPSGQYIIPNATAPFGKPGQESLGTKAYYSFENDVFFSDDCFVSNPNSEYASPILACNNLSTVGSEGGIRVGISVQSIGNFEVGERSKLSVNPFIINKGTCSSASGTGIANVGDTVTCTYPLTGNPTGNYTRPSQNQIQLGANPTGGPFNYILESYFVNSDGFAPRGNNCTISGTNLICDNLQITNATPTGIKQTRLTVFGYFLTDGLASFEVINATPITSANIGDSVCSNDNKAFVGERVTCIFPLTGSPNGSYYLPQPSNPSDPFTGLTRTRVYNDPTSGNFGGNNPNEISDTCTVIVDNLICSNINTFALTPGSKVVSINGQNIGEFSGSTLLFEASPPTVINDTNIGNGFCSGRDTEFTNPADQFVRIGEIMDCSFPLTGDANNNYVLPTVNSADFGGVQSAIATTGPNADTGFLSSDPCIVNGSTLRCNNIATTGVLSPAQQSFSVIQNNKFVAGNRVNVKFFRATTITDANISSATCSQDNLAAVGEQVTCVYPLSGDANGLYVIPTTPTDPNGTSLRSTIIDGPAFAGTQFTGDPCVVVGSSLVCPNIPTAGLDPNIGPLDGLGNSFAAGVKIIRLLNEGAVISSSAHNSSIKLSGANPTTITGVNIGNGTCVSLTGNDILIPSNLINCNFPLIGSPNNSYVIDALTTGITSGDGRGFLAVGYLINGSTNSASDTCTVNGQTLVCLNMAAYDNATQTRIDYPVGEYEVKIQASNIGVLDNKSSFEIINPTIITRPNIGTAVCSEDDRAVVGELVTCIFPLTGDPNGNYAIPTSIGDPNGTTLIPKIYDAPGLTGTQLIGEFCRVVASSLVCPNIPTAGLNPNLGNTEGFKGISIGNFANQIFEVKAQVQLQVGAPTIIGDANVQAQSGTCLSSTGNITTRPNESVNCSFPLTGDPNGSYLIPRISGASPDGRGLLAIGQRSGDPDPSTFSDSCTVNGTILVCLGMRPFLPTITSDFAVGTYSVSLSQSDVGLFTNKASFEVSLTASNGNNCDLNSPCLLDTIDYSFNPLSNTALFNVVNSTLTVAPNLYSNNAASGNKYVCKVQLKLDGKTDTDTLGGFAARTSESLSGGVNGTDLNTGTVNEAYQVDYNNATGGCAITFDRTAQLSNAWFYKIKVVEVDASNTEVGSLYQANTGYNFQLGAVGVVTIS